MLRPITADDRETYIAFAKAFYASEAVCHAISEKNICDAFESFVDGNPFAECYIVTDNGESAGYVLCAKTYSQEAGGMTMWIDEIYVSPEHRGKGLGSAALIYIEGKCANEGYRRMRLEYTKENEGAHKLYKSLGYGDLPYLQMVKDRNDVK